MNSQLERNALGGQKPVRRVIWPTAWMVRKFVRNHGRVENQRTRLGYVRLECSTSIFGNLFLGTAKLILGVLTGSIALTADAAHTYGDMVSSVVLLVSMRLAALPPDAKHPRRAWAGGGVGDACACGVAPDHGGRVRPFFF